MINVVTRHFIMRVNVEVPVKLKEFDIHPKMIDILLVILIYVDENTQVFFDTNGHFQPTPFPFLS
jgi:hypothetical protein